MAIFCQFCGTPNPLGREFCSRCGNTLTVVSGIVEETDAPEEFMYQAQEDLEEHLIERITNLEESLRHLSRAVAATAEHIQQIEHNLTVAHAGVQTLGGLLENRGVLSRTEVLEDWERTVGNELLSRDLARRFAERAPRILSQARHSGHASPDFVERLNAVELALAGPDHEMARSLLTEMARLAPANDELWSFIGEASFETGDLLAAKIAFSRVLDLRGPHYETLVYLGTVLSDLGETERAELSLLHALELQPESFLPLFALGALSVSCARFAEGLGFLTRAVSQQNGPQCHYLIGTCHLELGHPGRAIASLKAAVELAPDFAEAQYLLGIAYLRRGWRKRASEAFKSAFQKNSASLLYRETVRLMKLKPVDDAGPRASRLALRAEEALEHGRSDAAYEFLLDAAKHEEGAGHISASVALLASTLGRGRDAVHFGRRLLGLDEHSSPFHPAGVVALLEGLRQRRRWKSVQRLSRKVYRENTDPLTRSLAAYELALVQSQLGEDLPEAREVALYALEHAPREFRQFPLLALGTVAVRSGRVEEALRYLEQAADAGPSPYILRQLEAVRKGADGGGTELKREPPRTLFGDGGLDDEMLGHIRRLGSVLKEIKSA